MLAAGCPSAAQIWRVKAATEVLPLVPVTAAMVVRLARIEPRRGERERAARIADRTKATPSGSGAGGTRSAMIAAAPAASACADEAQAVVLGAGTATNRSPGLTVRLSARDAARRRARRSARR